MWKKFINWFELMGTMRAASELARQGFHQEAKSLMCGIKTQERAQFIHGVIVAFLIFMLVANENAGRGIIKDKRNRVTDMTFILNS